MCQSRYEHQGFVRSGDGCCSECGVGKTLLEEWNELYKVSGVAYKHRTA